MNEHPPVPRLVTTERRELIVSQLCDQFAAGNLELDELERRLAVSDRAQSEIELDALLSDLPALADARPPQFATRRPAKRGWALALLGTSSRKGEWTPPRQMNALAVMGGLLLDFRDARLAPGVTHVIAVAVMGAVEVKVPPGLPVEVRGLGIMGAVDQFDQESGAHHPQAPILKITALACMGAVEVKTMREGDQ